MFIAFIAPFGGFFVAGLKRSIRQNQLAGTLHRGGVIDRIDCIIITGFFLLIYFNMMINSQPGETSNQIKEMILTISDDAQRELYFRLKDDILAIN